MNSQRAFALLLIAGLGIAGNFAFVQGQTAVPADNKELPDTDCTVEKIGSSIPVSSIGEPVGAVTFSAPRWLAGTGIAYCQVDGTIAPVDTSANGRPINFRVVLPASWSRRAVQ